LQIEELVADKTN